jgi:SAM-dependent methyltransferase
LEKVLSNNLKTKQITDIYSQRFRDRDEQRQQLWKTLCVFYFQRYIKKGATVVDLAAGYCEFINNIEAKRRIAIDLNPDTKKYADKKVEVFITSSTKLPRTLNDKADVVFVSNFFEHLDSKHELLETLAAIKSLLKKNGRLMILQPNIRLTKEAYWDFVDHSLPLTEKSLTEALTLSGYDIELLKTRFLPYTTSSRLPISSFLIRIYLKLSIVQRLVGKQTFVIATNPASAKR